MSLVDYYGLPVADQEEWELKPDGSTQRWVLAVLLTAVFSFMMGAHTLYHAMGRGASGYSRVHPDDEIFETCLVDQEEQSTLKIERLCQRLHELVDLETYKPAEMSHGIFYKVSMADGGHFPETENKIYWSDHMLNDYPQSYRDEEERRIKFKQGREFNLRVVVPDGWKFQRLDAVAPGSIWQPVRQLGSDCRPEHYKHIDYAFVSGSYYRDKAYCVIEVRFIREVESKT